MTSYSTFALADLLDAFAAGEPAPGGGSASAVAGALGVSLLLMVANLPKTRHGTDEETADLAAAAARLRPLRDSLVALVDEDSAAYGEVVEAYRLPRSGSAEAAGTRREAIDQALRRATDAPLDVMRACQQALRGSLVVAAAGAASAASDVAVGVETLTAALRGAGAVVDANLHAIRDRSYVDRATAERRQLETDGAADAERARTELRNRGANQES